MKRIPVSVGLLAISILAVGCSRFPGSYWRDCSTTTEQLAGSYTATPSPKSRGPDENLADVLSGRQHSEVEKPVVVELRRIGRREFAVRPLGGGAAGEFALTGRMRGGMFIFRNDVDVSGIPWILEGMHYDHAALGKTEAGDLVVVERTKGWGGVLFFRFGGMSSWSSEYPVHVNAVSGRKLEQSKVPD